MEELHVYAHGQCFKRPQGVGLFDLLLPFAVVYISCSTRVGKVGRSVRVGVVTTHIIISVVYHSELF